MALVTPKSDQNQVELKLPKWKANFWLGILWLIFIIDIMDRQAINAILPAIKKAYMFSDAQLGLISSVMGVTISLCVFPLAILIDRWSRRKMVSIMVMFWSLATYATGLATTFGGLLAARAAVGLGESAYTPASMSMISAMYPKKQRGTVIGIYQTGQVLGGAAGIALAGYLAVKYGWKSVFGVLAVPGIILAVIAWFMPDFKAKKMNAETQKSSDPKIKDVIGHIFKTPTLLFIYLGSAAIFFSANTLGTWEASFYGRSFGMSVRDAALFVASAKLVAWIGAPLCGWVSDFLLKYTSKGRMLAAGIVVALYGITILIATQIAQHDKVINHTFIVWVIGATFLAGYWGTVNSSTQDLVPAFMRGTAYSLVPLANYLLAGIWGPIIAGAIADKIGLTSALQIIVAVSVVLGIFFFYMASRFWDRDMERAKIFGEI
ncbi:MFS transporter, partial [Desulfosporosinus metallidurans]|uniref:MFS transporter n=1 Tax=Desulfosporosinus metallidurans TaxID=1888891 RepID=UPI00094D93C4